MSRHADDLPDESGGGGDYCPSTSACGAEDKSVHSDACDAKDITDVNVGASRAGAALVAEQVIAVLAAHHMSRPDTAKVASFIRVLDARRKARQVWLRYLTRWSGWGTMDILRFIHRA